MKLARPLWMRCALPSDSYAIAEPLLEDGIPAEVYKRCLESLGPWLHRVITKVWLCEAVPNKWSEAVTSEYARTIEALA